MTQDRHQRAKERFADCMDDMREQHARIREDLRFSNPVAPQQWSDDALTLRAGRPTETFDNTNKFIFQVVNDGRASVPSIQTVPADGFAHAKAADALNGRIRHIEYASRAHIAYETSLDLSARCGLGWIGLVPQILNPETNQQEPRIRRFTDSCSVVLEAGWQEPDGSDAEYGFVLAPMLRKKFIAKYGKDKDSSSWNDEGRLWTMDDSIVVAEYFEFVKKKVKNLLITAPDGERIALSEEEYRQVSSVIGMQPEFEEFHLEDRKTTWTKMTGCEELESTTFPSKYIPLVPVIGNELWVDGKRYLGGLTRQLMGGQRMHNSEMAALMESMLGQPKAPFMVAARAIKGFKDAWSKLNRGNPAYLPYNDVDPENPTNPSIAMPQRLQPPQMPTAFANGAVMGTNAMNNAIGVFKSGLGQETSNAISGVAKQQDRRESNTATYHYRANLNMSLQHVGRIMIDMDRRLTDTARNVRTMGEDGKSGQIRYDPQLRDAVQMNGEEVVAINPTIGEYDLRVKVGPSYLTQNEETASELGEMFKGAPQLLPVLGPVWVDMKGVPNSGVIKKLLIAMADPKVQAIYAEQENENTIPAAAKAAIQQRDEQIKQLAQALENAAAEADKTGVEKAQALTNRQKAEADVMIRGYEAVTKRLALSPPGSMTAQQIMAIVQQTVRDSLTIQPVEPAGFEEPLPEPPAPMQSESPMPEPMAEQPPPDQPIQEGQPS